MSYKAKVFLITFFSYVSIHALRTTYSFSKGSIADTVAVKDSQIGTSIRIQGSLIHSCCTH
jgi:sugar phosphate permease